MRLPGSNHLDTLKRDRKRQWDIRIKDRWRLWFEWQAGDGEGADN
ncbi:MAG: type II toxin-antitoxin system RelE/ParE family toxin [Thermodesulfobacteriota bacterium]